MEKVIIVGGGVIGLACAIAIREKGFHVDLYERGVVGSGASGAALGALWLPAADRTNALTSFHYASHALLESWCKEIRQTSGIDLGFDQCGSLKIFQSLRERGQSEARGAQLLTDSELDVHQSRIRSSGFGGEFSAFSCKLHVDDALQALRHTSKAAGVHIFEHTEVDAISIESGKVTGMFVGDKLVPGTKILVAGGSWTSLLHPILSKYAPVKPVRGQGILLHKEIPPIEPILRRGSQYLLSLRDGEFLVGSSTEPDSGFHEETTAEVITSLKDFAADIVPELRGAELVRSWAGLRPRSADGLPILGDIPEAQGLFVATGHYKIGFAAAPLTARWIADLMCDGLRHEEMAPFLPERFLKSSEN